MLNAYLDMHDGEVSISIWYLPGRLLLFKKNPDVYDNDIIVNVLLFENSRRVGQNLRRLGLKGGLGH